MSLMPLLISCGATPPWSSSSSPTEGTEQQHLSYSSHQELLPP